MVEKLLHQRLGISQRDEALPEVAGGEDSVFVAQSAGRAAVIGDRDDNGEVGGVCLETAQQRAEAGAATDGHDARAPALQSESVDDLDHAAGAVAWKEWAEDGLGELQVAEDQDSDSQGGEDQGANRVGPELEGYVIELTRQLKRAVGRLKTVGESKHQY